MSGMDWPGLLYLLVLLAAAGAAARALCRAEDEEKGAPR